MKEISKKNFDGYKYVDGGVCAAKGFKANGLYCGIILSINSVSIYFYTVNKVIHSV